MKKIKSILERLRRPSHLYACFMATARRASNSNSASLFETPRSAAMYTQTASASLSSPPPNGWIDHSPWQYRGLRDEVGFVFHPGGKSTCRRASSGLRRSLSSLVPPVVHRRQFCAPLADRRRRGRAFPDAHSTGCAHGGPDLALSDHCFPRLRLSPPIPGSGAAWPPVRSARRRWLDFKVQPFLIVARSIILISKIPPIWRSCKTLAATCATGRTGW